MQKKSTVLSIMDNSCAQKHLKKNLVFCKTSINLLILFYLISFIKFYCISKVDDSYQRKEKEIPENTNVANNVKHTKIDRELWKSAAQSGN